mgnify:CR=1 FL=1
MKTFKLLMIGDIVGRPGRNIIRQTLPSIKRKYEADYVIANGENAAGGNGITEKIAQELFISGIDFLTMGNHVWDNKDVFNFIDKENRMVRPANYPGDAPGKGYQIIQTDKGVEVGILNISGRTFMNALDCPFKAAEDIVKEIRKKTKIIIVDFHAEATSEKIAMIWLFIKICSGISTPPNITLYKAYLCHEDGDVHTDFHHVISIRKRCIQE